MKLLVISDIHGKPENLETVLESFNRENFNGIIILGDILYHGPRNQIPEGYSPQKVAEILNLYKSKIIAVKGNCDSEVDQMMLEFPIMSEYSWIVLGEKRIFLSHGHGLGPEKLPPLNPGDIIISGHTHIPVGEKRSFYIQCNPGSISIPKDENGATYGVLTEEGFYIKNIKGDIVKVIFFNK